MSLPCTCNLGLGGDLLMSCCQGQTLVAQLLVCKRASVAAIYAVLATIGLQCTRLSGALCWVNKLLIDRHPRSLAQ